MIETNGTGYFEMNGFSVSIFTDALYSMDKGTGMIYFFSGINMKNMVAVPMIVNKLNEAFYDFQAARLNACRTKSVCVRVIEGFSR
jgi:hypothetical protein